MTDFRSDSIQRLEIALNAQYCEDIWTPSNIDASTIDGKNVYKPGGQVEGTVCIDVGSQALKFAGIYLSVKGYLYVGFNPWETERLSSHALMLEQKPKKLNVAEKEYIILSRQELLGGAPGYLVPGEHHFPFKFNIPDDIPSSFDGAFGFVDYWIEAFIDQTPFGLGIRRWRRDIIIHGFFDFPTDLYDLFPVERGQEEEAQSCCRQSGTYGYTMVLAKRRYASEEIVSPNFTLNNQTPNSSEATVKIMKEVTYSAGFGVMKERQLIGEASTMVNPHSSFQWNSRILLGSHLVPSKTCPHITVLYKLQFRYGPTVCQGMSYVELTSKINIFPFIEDCPSQSPPITTEPRTYIHPPMDLTAFSVPSATGNTVSPSYPEKGGNPSSPGYRPQAETGAPPLLVTRQPLPATALPTVVSDQPPPPSYLEACSMEQQSHVADSSHSVSESTPEAQSQEDGKNTE